MIELLKKITPALWGMIVLCVAADISLLVFYTPVEQSMGPIQKIFYLHLPVAINTFLACLTVFIASIGYLWQRDGWWDDLAQAGARISVQFCAVVLLTGMIWGRGAWGVWWTWSPRLTFSLVLFFLYAVYLLLHSSIQGYEKRAMICAVYGVIAFLDVPLVWLSARMMPDIHPGSITLAPEMRWTLIAWFVPVTLLNVLLIGLRFRLNRSASQAQALEPSPDVWAIHDSKVAA